jgi:DNA (cytosine-5)-methyltransferase 1
MRPRLLDLFCGAGGAAMGYHRAGFDVVGVDIAPQPRYPFTFVQADALEFLGEIVLHPEARFREGFDAIHASPPCKRFNVLSRNLGSAGSHPDLLTPMRELLKASGLPWVIENVPGAPMRPDLKLCGCMFGLPGLKRERWFEFWRPVFEMRQPCRHIGQTITVVGGGPDYRNPHRAASLADKKRAMGIDWMTRDGLAQAIPPAYTEHIGTQLLAAIEAGDAA